MIKDGLIWTQTWCWFLSARHSPARAGRVKGIPWKTRNAQRHKAYKDTKKKIFFVSLCPLRLCAIEFALLGEKRIARDNGVDEAAQAVLLAAVLFDNALEGGAVREIHVGARGVGQEL